MSLDSYANYISKIRFFEANKFLKAEFTCVNEDFQNVVQRRKSNL